MKTETEQEERASTPAAVLNITAITMLADVVVEPGPVSNTWTSEYAYRQSVREKLIAVFVKTVSVPFLKKFIFCQNQATYSISKT